MVQNHNSVPYQVTVHVTSGFVKHCLFFFLKAECSPMNMTDDLNVCFHYCEPNKALM